MSREAHDAAPKGPWKFDRPAGFVYFPHDPLSPYIIAEMQTSNDDCGYLAAAAPELRDALIRTAENLAFILSRCSITDQWYAKFSRELEEDRAVLRKAKGEV